MRKNINKLVAVAIGVSVMSGSIIPAFAADTTTQNTSTTTNVQAQTIGKQVLTLDDAITAAINNSNKVALQIKKINLEDDKLDVQDDIDDDGYLYDNQELTVKQEKENKDFLEDQIAQDITNEYNDIVTKGKELNKLKKEIEIKNKEIKDTELKKKLGLVTSIDMKNAEIELQTLNNSEKDKENKLKNSQDYFKVLTDKDLNNCTLEQDVKYEVFRIDGSVDEYLENVIEKYCEYDKESSDLLKDYIKDIKEDFDYNEIKKAPQISDFNDEVVTTMAGDKITIKTAKEQYDKAYDNYNKGITGYKTYLETKYNSSVKSISLEEKKKNYKQILNQSYANLLDLENSINVMKSNIEVNNKQLSIAKLKYDMGLMTKTEYDKQALASEDLETSLRTLIENYNKLKNNIQKPWIINSTNN